MIASTCRASRALSRRIALPTSRPQSSLALFAASAQPKAGPTARLQTKKPLPSRSSDLHSCRRRLHLRRHLHVSRQVAAMSAAETDAQELQVTPDSLSKTLQEKLGATHCAIEDMSGGCGQAFEAIIVSSQFEKKNSLARHRLVNGALKQEIAAIHAWTSKCYTPEEWEKKQSS